MKNTILFIALILSSISYAQDTSEEKLPYYEVPEYSKEFTAGTMAARMVDGLGFRFYWSSEGLTEKDLAYRPSEEVRSSEETIDHILDLSYIIVNSTLKKPNSRVDKSVMGYEDKRKQTLINLKTAADILRDSDDISQYKIIFGENEIPFWNQVNGPIADAIWHCGQLASFRRVTGNPINPKVNHFTGKVKKTDE
ncbi:hypothetical protein [uncultured Psychroserpens sp.]|uniref:hypothetical protein n=1 Tax=uncultured Psychroserpens sp. TaxID=255436 RepID=UPI002605D476|nr:hypothetical protein [uncultured Psychroserpens sp.]